MALGHDNKIPIYLIFYLLKGDYTLSRRHEAKPDAAKEKRGKKGRSLISHCFSTDFKAMSESSDIRNPSGAPR